MGREARAEASGAMQVKGKMGEREAKIRQEDTDAKHPKEILHFTERDKMWSRLAEQICLFLAHSAESSFSQQVPHFKVSRQKCGLLAFGDKTVLMPKNR